MAAPRPNRPWGGGTDLFKGAAEVHGRLLQLATAFPLDAGHAAREEAVIEITEMAKRAPIGGMDDDHRGRLRESAAVSEPLMTEDGTEITLSFDTPYAVAQHQRYFEHPHGGERQYMESVLEESRQFLGTRLVKRLEARLAGRIR